MDRASFFVIYKYSPPELSGKIGKITPFQDLILGKKASN
jgi:hypothetical protein